MGRPIKDKHAIEVIAFVVTFERPFTGAAIEGLLTLKEVFKDKYPIFSETNVVSMRMKLGDTKEKNLAQNSQESTSERSGVSLQKIGADGKPEWMLRADGNNIVISCYNYDRWAIESPKAIEDLSYVMKIIADDNNLVQYFALQTVDRFVGNQQKTYKIKDVFNSKSKYLNKNIFAHGPLWHLHQGWFEDINADKQLNILNLGTNDTPSGVISTIDHIIRYLFNEPKSVLELSEIDFLTSIFNILHEKNKNILEDLLVIKQQRAIQLCS